ncbi:MAG: hypothetical protein M1839_000155 [Geoglossum umbratile]|nr:MAG: hypothetical protein M1839_000155 [Geoglossum umbratile]
MEENGDIIPKVEEVEDDDDSSQGPTIKSSEPSTPIGVGATPSPPVGRVPAAVNSTTGRRPRGRPRKHPVAPASSSVQKTTKGRSKTGCITCRRRKKKCDETKPECLNCQKNAVVCEGYPEKTFWQPGKQRSEEALKPTRPRELPCLVDGVETEVDRKFLDHFVYTVSRILTLFNDDSNPFKEILLPMAIRHRGLMHSLLCLSGSHLASRDPKYGERQNHHFLAAINHLRTDKKMSGQASGNPAELVDDPTVASTLVLCLNSICKGETAGEYRPHMDAARHLVLNQQSKNQQFGQFLFEFFMYHDVLNSLTSLDRRPLLLTGDIAIPEFITQPATGVLLGVLDGLFSYISKITVLRDNIRTRKASRLDPAVDYVTLSDAVEIDSGIRSWVSNQQEDHFRHTAALLYRQCTWVYLYRTIQPSRPSPKIARAVDTGLEYLRELPSNSSTQSVLLMPLFMLGCAAFEPGHRPEISRGFDSIKNYSNLGNIEPARQVVERVWELIDAGDERSWDWETIMQNMEWDFLVT